MTNELRGFSTVKGDRDLKEIVKTSGWHNYYADGTKEMDLQMGGSAYTLGYNNSEITKDLEKNILSVARCQSNNGNFTEATLEAGSFVCGGVWNSFAWALSGTSAVEAAISMSDEYWKAHGKNKQKIVSFSFAWHGTSYLTKDLGAPFLLQNHTGRVININHPTWNNIEDRENAETTAISSFVEAIDQNPGEIGCIIFDSATWINGVVPFSKWWWETIRQLCDQHDILMITDDVASGWGKSCSYHPYQTFGYGIQPDISAVGKSLTAGYAPMGAALCNEKVGDIVSKPKVWNYNHTWQPSMIGIYMMLNVKEYIEKHDLMMHSNVISEKLNLFGQELLDNGYIDNFRNNGLFLVLDIKDRNEFVSGLSNSRGNDTKIRICAPLIADDVYFENLREYVYGSFS